MQFSMAVPNFRQWASPSVMATLAQKAEECGFTSVWLADHVLVPNHEVERLGVEWCEAFTTAGYLAAVTKRIRIAFGVVVLPYRPPLAVAKMASTIDVLSGGRLLLGVAAGYVEKEFEALGVPFNERGPRTDEAIHVIKEAWTSPAPTFNGRFFRMSNVVFEPKPLQKPHPPIWVGGNSPAAIRRAAHLGDGWTPWLLLANELAPLARLLRSETQAAGRSLALPVCAGVASVRVLDASPGQARPPMTGTPDEIIADIRAYEKAGATELRLRFTAYPSLEESLRAIDRFQRDVRPAFKSA